MDELTFIEYATSFQTLNFIRSMSRLPQLRIYFLEIFILQIIQNFLKNCDSISIIIQLWALNFMDTWRVELGRRV